jgi:hypothetical protein
MATKHRFKHALTLVRNRLKKGNGVFICCSLEMLADRNEISATTCREVREFIRYRLDHHYTLENWIESKHGEEWMRAAVEMSCDNRTRKMQVTRIAWLDSLIEEFS